MKKENAGHNGPRQEPEGGWEWQLRINLSEKFAKVARSNPNDPSLKPLMDVLVKYDAVIKNQFDAFAGYLPQYKNHEEVPLMRKINEAGEAIAKAEAASDTKAGIEALKAFEEASDNFLNRYRLYLWTKDLVENPAKEAQYANRFTVYADGGKEVYGKKFADGLEKDLQPLVDSGMITKISKFDTNPAKNPQPPSRFHG